MNATVRTNGRVAIVTGGSRGVGLQTARRLSQDGIAVVIDYAGNADEAGAAVAQRSRPRSSVWSMHPTGCVRSVCT